MVYALPLFKVLYNIILQHRKRIYKPVKTLDAKWYCEKYLKNVASYTEKHQNQIKKYFFLQTQPEYEISAALFDNRIPFVQWYYYT